MESDLFDPICFADTINESNLPSDRTKFHELWGMDLSDWTTVNQPFVCFRITSIEADLSTSKQKPIAPDSKSLQRYERESTNTSDEYLLWSCRCEPGIASGYYDWA
jgi:hypothetical protein